MRIRRAVLAAAAAVAIVPALASAQGIEGRWSIAFQGGTDFELGGNVHEGGSGSVLTLPTSVEARSFADVYDPGFRGQLSVGYGVAPRGELFLRGPDLGFRYDVGPSVALGIEAGVRYQTGLAELEGLAGTGLEPINDTGSRWSLPVVATVAIRF